MDFAISSRVWADAHLSTSEKVVLLALDHLGDRDGFSWNGYERLSEVTGINLESKYLTKIINKLEKNGYILIWRQHGRKGGRGYTHIYWPIIGRTDTEILEIVMRRFVATEDEARAIIGQSGPIYEELVKRNRVSGKTLEDSREIKKGVPKTPKNETGDKKGVPGTLRSKDSSSLESYPNKETPKDSLTPNGVGDLSPPEPDKPKKQLMGIFTTETGLKMPHRKSDVGFWWSSIREIYEIVDNDVGAGGDLIRRAVKKMRADSLTISNPNSIINICRTLAAEKSVTRNGTHLSAQQLALAQQYDQELTQQT